MPGADFDPFQGLDEEEKAYLNGQRQAFAKQKAVHEAANAAASGDEERRKAAEEHMRAVQAAAGFVPTVPQASAARPRVAPGSISILVARPEHAAHELPSTTEKYAPDWAALKEVIAKYDGTWVVSRYEFLGNVANILGFFGKEGWVKPEECEKQKFEVIVKNGRVFKTDPE